MNDRFNFATLRCVFDSHCLTSHFSDLEAVIQRSVSGGLVRWIYHFNGAGDPTEGHEPFNTINAINTFNTINAINTINTLNTLNILNTLNTFTCHHRSPCVSRRPSNRKPHEPFERFRKVHTSICQRSRGRPQNVGIYPFFLPSDTEHICCTTAQPVA